MKKRILGLLLALCLVVGLLPMTALAAETDACFVFPGANGGTVDVVMQPDSPTRYFRTVDGYVTETDADANNYNVMVSWIVGGKPTVTLKGANIKSGKDGINIGQGSNARYEAYHVAPADIVVVEDSTLDADTGTGYCAIVSYTTGTVTISAVNNAKLTLNAARTGANNGVIECKGNVILKNLKADISVESESRGAGTIVSFTGNVTIEDSFLTAASYGIRAKNNILIKNSEVYQKVNSVGGGIIATDGTITLEESTVAMTVRTGSSGHSLFNKLPILVCSTGATVVTSRQDSFPSVGADGTIVAPAESEDVEYATLPAGGTYAVGTIPYQHFFGVYPNPPHVHAPAADDGDCTTAVMCTTCQQEVTPSAAAHVAGADDGDCTTAVACTNTGCTKNAVEAKTHTGGEATCAKKAECATCGKEYGELKPHTATRTDCSVVANCTVCGGVAYEAGQHSGGTATCKAKAKCEHCDKEYGELAACKPAADDGDCATAVKCTVCNEVVTAAKEHKYTNNTDTSCDNAGCTHTRKVETPSNKPNTNNPQTGDEFNMALWVTLLVVSAVGFAAVLVFGKKRAVK